MVLTKAGSILGPIATVLGYVMDILFRFTSSFGVFNVGLCIILFTIVMKTLMIPLTIKQQKTTKLMSVMNPEIQAIQKKYKGKSDQESMQRQNVEIQAVYEKYGTSMTGGCLPLLIQMPILLALYRVIYNIRPECCCCRENEHVPRFKYGRGAGLGTVLRMDHPGSCGSIPVVQHKAHERKSAVHIRRCRESDGPVHEDYDNDNAVILRVHLYHDAGRSWYLLDRDQRCYNYPAAHR